MVDLDFPPPQPRKKMGYVPMPISALPREPKNGPIAGDMYFDPVTGVIKIWTGHEWRHLEGKSLQFSDEEIPKRPPYYDRWDIEE